jgi:hypothetical protein
MHKRAAMIFFLTETARENPAVENQLIEKIFTKEENPDYYKG